MMQFQAGGLVWSRLFPSTYAFEVGTILIAAVTAIYVLVGGMRSIAWSDVLQGLLLMGGMLLGGIAVLTLTGGPTSFGQKLMELPTSSLTLPGNSGTWHWSKMMTVVLFAALAGILQPAQWMRLYSSKNREALRKSALCFAICLPPCFLLGTMLVGLGGQILYPLEWDESGFFRSSSAVGGYDEIFVVILRDVLPSVLGSFGILLGAVTLVAIMAASMSTADSSLHALSAVTVRDIYKRIFRPNSGERETLNVGRLVILFASVLAVFLVVRGKHLERAGDSSEILQMLVALGLVAVAFTSQLLPATIDVLFIRRGTSLGAVVGLTLGLTGAFVFGPLLGSFANASEAWDKWNLVQSLLRNVEILKTAVPIDASAWGLLFNTVGFAGVSLFSKPVSKETRKAFANLVN
jgi:SSS family solute:Na+ symporter